MSRLPEFFAELRDALAEARSGSGWAAPADRIGTAAMVYLGEGEQLLLTIGLAKSLSPEGKRALAEAAAADAIFDEKRAAVEAMIGASRMADSMAREAA